MRPAAVLLVLACLAFAPFFGYPEWRGTEARRVRIAQEMLETGEPVVPRLWGAATYTKPPLHYWMLAASADVFGMKPWSMRLPSVVGFWLLAVFAFHCLRRWCDVTTAWVGAVGMLLSPILAYDGPFAEIDPLFSALTVASILCLSDGVYERRRASLVIAGVLGGLAVLTKGPPYFMFCAGPFLIWWRHARLRGIAWYLPLVLGFSFAYEFALDGRAPAEEVAAVMIEETLGRMAFWEPGSLKGLPAHALTCVVGIGLPFSFWWPRWWGARADAGGPRRPRVDFLIWAAIGAFAVLVFSAGRSTRYLMPAVPLVVFGLAPFVADSLRSAAVPRRGVQASCLVLAALAAIALIIAPWAPYPYPGTTVIPLAALAMLGAFVGSEAALTRFALGVTLAAIWLAFPDRVDYFATAGGFQPPRARVLARELGERGIGRVRCLGEVKTSMLLHALEHLPELEIEEVPPSVGPAGAPWVLIQDRGVARPLRPDPGRGPDDVAVVPGYRDVLRIQTGRHQSVSLRERR